MSAEIPEKDGQDVVWVSVGLTKNLGNYESLRLDAGSRRVIPANASEAERDQAWEKAWAEVEEQIERKILEANQELVSE